MDHAILFGKQELQELIQESWNQPKNPKIPESRRRKFRVADPSLRRNTQNGRNHQSSFWHILSGYFTTLTNSKKIENGIMGLYTTQAKYLHI